MHKFIFILLIAALPYVGLAQDHPAIIPVPAEYKSIEASFFLDRYTPISVLDDSFDQEAHFLQQELLKQQGVPLAISPQPASGGIHLSKVPELGEAYRLSISGSSVSISSGTDGGIFYGIISFIQLVNQAEVKGGQYELPGWEITDRPTFGWRGIMLDESRYFFGKEKVKQILDWMAYYKLNKFHWHLTDSPGWRIEIKKYPKLTLVGGIGNHGDEYAEAKYYTQEEIKDIVRYAQERKIEIIPEIDMPGHATAANRAYPEFSGGGSERYPEFTFHPAKEGTYQYLTDILREVNALFPSNMIHLGGDEVSFGNEKWKTDPQVQALMQKEKLTSLKDVEDYFFQRMADSLKQMNNKVLAWDEMASVDLDRENSVLFWWRHDQPQQLELALENGFPTILCPRIPFYFDFVQMESHRSGRKWAGAYSPLEDVYQFTLDQLNVPEAKKDLILGLQANLWTETVQDGQRLDFLLFPRIAAIAEASWSPDNQKNYKSFLSRLGQHLPLYQRDGIYYFDPFEPENHPEPIYRP